MKVYDNIFKMNKKTYLLIFKIQTLPMSNKVARTIKFLKITNTNMEFLIKAYNDFITFNSYKNKNPNSII